MMRLAGLLDEAGGAVFYDLLAHANFDLQAWFNTGCTSHRPCHILALVEGLPAGTATQAHRARMVADGGGESGELSAEEKRFVDQLTWSHTDRLLAVIHNRMVTLLTRRPEGEPAPSPKDLSLIGPLEWQDMWEMKTDGAAGDAPVKGESIQDLLGRLM